MKGYCEDCRWRYGEYCRRYPPQMTLYPSTMSPPLRYEMGEFYPNVAKTDWCGEFSPKTVKPEEF